MPTFDPELWRSRASQRFRKASDAGFQGAAASFSRDLHSIKQIEILVDWCYSKRLEVLFVRRSNGLYEREKKRISINGRLAPEAQLHVLMHECGHHLIGKPSPEERFGTGYQADDPNVKRTTLHRVDVVDEELEAWARGFKLAKRLHIELDVDRYNRTRSEYVKTYLKWAAKVDGWQGPLDEDDDG